MKEGSSRWLAENLVIVVTIFLILVAEGRIRILNFKFGKCFILSEKLKSSAVEFYIHFT